MPLPLFVNTVNVLLAVFAQTRSGWPSPLMSAVTTATGSMPTLSVVLEPKTPLPLLVNTVNVLSSAFAQTKAICPWLSTFVTATTEKRAATHVERGTETQDTTACCS